MRNLRCFCLVVSLVALVAAGLLFVVGRERRVVASYQPVTKIGAVLATAASEVAASTTMPGSCDDIGDLARDPTIARAELAYAEQRAIVDIVFEDVGLDRSLARALERDGFGHQDCSDAVDDCREALARLRGLWQQEVAMGPSGNPIVATHGDLWFAMLAELPALIAEGKCTVDVERRASAAARASFRIEPSSDDALLAIDTRIAVLTLRLRASALPSELSAPIRAVIEPLLSLARSEAPTEGEQR
ncbi:MAG TPA: hypothetical protein PKE00_07075 [Planctomycetota bacterium]|nr:hypothetical protein [Planctomycetota bacterium]